MNDRPWPGVGDWVEYETRQRGARVEHAGCIIRVTTKSVQVRRLNQQPWIPWESIHGWWPKGTKGKTPQKRRPFPAPTPMPNPSKLASPSRAVGTPDPARGPAPATEDA